MRLWLGLTPIFVLLLCLSAEDHKKHEHCPDHTVCVIFVNDRCTSATTKMEDQPQFKGKNSMLAHPKACRYIWKNHTTTPCYYESYGYIYARLDIEPLSATVWKVIATLFVKRGEEEAYTPKQYLFKFGRAELTFPNTNTSQFLYEQNGILKPSPDKTVTKNGTITTAYDRWYSKRNEYSFVRFSFEIDADGKNLIDFFGPKVEMKLAKMEIVLNDTAFPEQLKLLIPEPKAEGMTAQAKALLGVFIFFGVLSWIVAAVIIVWYLRKKGKIGTKATIRDSDSKAQTPGSTRRSCPAIAPAYTPPAPYELANPYEAPVPPLPNLATSFALLSFINGEATDHVPLEPCPEGSVCIFFGNDKCTVRGTRMTSEGYIWNVNTTCDKGNYGHAYARLDFEPVTASVWLLNATFHEKTDNESIHTPEHYKFDFGKAILTFPKGNTSLFSSKDGSQSKAHEMTKIDTFTSRYNRWYTIGHPLYEFNRYSFEIATNGENLIDCFGPEVSFNLSGSRHGSLNDTAFPEMLRGLAPESERKDDTSAKSKIWLGVGIGAVCVLLLATILLIVWVVLKRRKGMGRGSDSKAGTPGGKSSQRIDSTPAIAPAYTPPAPYELANPYEVPMPPVPK